jgi:glycosyltransferase involved in cell wall biosynthesis
MVSLIIPCLNSVLLQSNKHIQLIIVNDGSIDLSENIILNMEVKFKQELDEFIYIKQENQGVGAACNNAFKYATGEFVMLLDSDDVILPNSIELCTKFLRENEKYGFVRTNGYYVYEDNINERDRLLEVNDYMKNKENVFEDIFMGRHMFGLGHI